MITEKKYILVQAFKALMFNLKNTKKKRQFFCLKKKKIIFKAFGLKISSKFSVSHFSRKKP